MSTTACPCPSCGAPTHRTATGPAGGPLAVRFDESGDGPLVTASVAFDRPLVYGQHYSLALTYELPRVRSEVFLITPAYAYLPVVTTGDATTVTIVTPEERAWAVIIEPLECPEVNVGTYQCGATEGILVAALVEVTRPDALASSSAAVPVAGGALDMTISYFPGEQRWAAHLEALGGAALPVLEDLFGFPFQGPRSLTIAERGRQDIAGYEGTFICLASSCEIGISPLADDLTALHELAHLWTEDFAGRWMAEGLAEFMALRAADRLGPLVESGERGELERIADLPLDEWGAARYIIGASEEEVLREYTGYQESLRFFETLEATIELEGIQAANAAAAALPREIDSQTYLDALEEASGTPLDDLFLEEIFPRSYAPTLEQRRAVRGRLDELGRDVAAAELEPLRRIESLVDAWRFDSAEQALDEAEAALAAYLAARREVSRPRSLWTKVGLIGDDPDGELAVAANAFASGDFLNAAKHAERALGSIEGAGDAARVRVTVGASVLGILVVSAGAGFWYARRNAAAQAPPRLP